MSLCRRSKLMLLMLILQKYLHSRTIHWQAPNNFYDLLNTSNSTGTLEEIDSLMLISEGIVKVKFQVPKRLNAVVCLRQPIITFNVKYLKGRTKEHQKLSPFRTLYTLQN